MKDLNLIIVDDEQSARELLQNLLQDISWVNILAEADNVEEALAKILSRRPDVILLDIQMPGKDGFALVEALVEKGINVEVIFITAFEKYAIKAIKASAFDYLLKPVNKRELVTVLDKLNRQIRKSKNELKFNNLIRELNRNKRIKFQNRTGFVMIDPSEILYCSADSNYTNIHLESEKTLTVSMNLGKVEEKLSEYSFARISRSAIVNLKFLARVDRKSMTCHIINESVHQLNVSRNFLRSLEEHCDEYFSIN